MDGILDTVSAHHAIMPLINLLKPHGRFVTLGAPVKPLELQVFPLIMGMCGTIIRTLRVCLITLPLQGKYSKTLV